MIEHVTFQFCDSGLALIVTVNNQQFTYMISQEECLRMFIDPQKLQRMMELKTACYFERNEERIPHFTAHELLLIEGYSPEEIEAINAKSGCESIEGPQTFYDAFEN